MIVVGREFDDGSWTWPNLYAFIFAAPPNTALFHVAERGWTTTDYQLAKVIDWLAILAWQRTEDATRKTPQRFPTPVRRPFDVESEASPTVPIMGGYVATPMRVSEFLARRAERERLWRLRHGISEGGS
jgi:Family of unknown function (DUF5361)